MQQDFLQPQGTEQPQAPAGQPQTGQQQATTPASQPPVNFLSPDQQNQMVDSAVGAGPPPETPEAIPQGAGFGATQESPLEGEDVPASEGEQAEYQDLFLRFMAAVNDTREGKDGRPSPADAVIKLLSVKGVPAHEAVGKTAGLIVTQMTDMARRSGKQYSGPIIREAGLDLVVELLDIAKASGAIKNIPEEDTPSFEKLVELSALEAAKSYGEWQLRTGQADRQGHMNEIQEQMRREADAGELDDWGMEEMDPQVRARLAQQVRAQQQGQGGQPSGQGGQPSQLPTQGQPPVQGGM